MNRANALEHTVLHKGKDLMMRDTGDHVIDRTRYVAKRFVTSNAKDLILINADRVHRPVEGKFQHLPKINMTLAIGILGNANDCNRSRIKKGVEGMFRGLC